MLKKTIKTIDLDTGQELETDAYFNLTKAEALELNIRNDLEVIGRARNNNETMDAFHRILQMSYGVKTGDGRFIKVNQLGAPLYYEFKSTEAYSELFMELFSSASYAAEFIKAILPAEVVAAGAEGASSQAEVPGHLANHPSMQGYKKSEQPAKKTLDNFDTRPAAQPPAIADDAEYQEFLRYKEERSQAATVPLTEQPAESRVLYKTPEFTSEAELAAFEASQTPPAPVSTTQEEAGQSTPPRDELI